MSERLELVTDFAELRAGMIVVETVCEACPGGSGRHRWMLVHFEAGAEAETANGEFEVSDIWDVEPEAPCGCNVIDYRSVEARTLYRVIDGLENTTTTHTTKRKPVRA